MCSAVETPQNTRVNSDIDGLAYHRLAHLDRRTAQWWRPLSTVGVTLGIYLVILVGALIISVVWVLVPGLPTASGDLQDPLNPLDWLVMLGMLACMLPAAIWGVRWGGGRRGTIHSVAGRFRWGMMWRAATVVVPVYALVLGVHTTLFPPEDFAWPPLDGRLLLIAVVILALGPLQCAAEEYLFRGIPQQALGVWVRSPWWGIVLPVPLFVLGHGYDWVGQTQIAMFALATGFLAWKSGGLELPILVHSANNMVLFVLAPFSVSSMRQGAIDPISMVFELPLLLGVTIGLSAWVSRRHGIGFWEPVRSQARRLVDPGAQEFAVATNAAGATAVSARS